MDHWYDYLATLFILGCFFWWLITVVVAVAS